MKAQDREQIIRHNPKIDYKLVEEQARLERELKRFGVELKVRNRLGIPIRDANQKAKLLITRPRAAPQSGPTTE
ncbi:MAG: hypothetical protein OXM02_01160 [Bacteroidota bacterium]|nr:hypothetical protein [Bacteroidota bacterium]MDE2833114.1 hypothetical protein [Bacteroidota bacterium]MDE2955885.1 hypothetical protein [Bacteroidota bacterium]